LVYGNQSAATNLKDSIVYFSDQDVSIEFLRDIRWPNACSVPNVRIEGGLLHFDSARWKCKNVHPRQQFSVKVGTIFEDSPIGLDKWLPEAWLVTNCKNGISSYELSRDLKVTQRTSWFMLHRVRHAMRLLSFEKFEGETEADETFVGGKIKNMHKRRKKEVPKGHKSIVLGLLNRETGEVRAKVSTSRMKERR
jgi:hypothetical protein